jgi:hypothetical protein
VKCEEWRVWWVLANRRFLWVLNPKIKEETKGLRPEKNEENMGLGPENQEEN